MRHFVNEKPLYILIAIVSGLLLAVSVLETLAYHDRVDDVTVAGAQEPELTRYGIDLFIDVYRVRLSYDWRTPTTHGTSNGIGGLLERGDEVSVRVGRITGLILSSTDQGTTRYLALEPSYVIALLSFLVYPVRAARRPVVMLIAAVIQAYAGIWLGIANFL